MVTSEEYKRAERDLTLAEWHRGWLIHAAVYGGVMSGLVTLNVLLSVYTDAGFLWFPFPLVGWGIGLALHYLHGVRWADREIRTRQEDVERYAEASRLAA